MKIMKKLSAFMLSLIMIIGMVPVVAVKAEGNSTASAITLGNVKWNSERTTYTFPYATANFTSDGQKIFCLSVSDGGYFVPSEDVDLGSGTDVKITGITQDSGSSVATDDIKKGGKYSSISVIDRSTDSVGVVTNEKIEKFLHSLVFYRNTTDTSKVQTVTVLGNQVKLDSNMTAMAIDGVIHYYKYVEYDLSDSTSTWYTAYNEAKSDAQKFNGMRGYLATITSADEQFYLYSNITTKSGDNNIMAWIGGARTKDGTMAFDAQSISAGILDPGKAWTDDMATKWRWVCGPEAGLQFWEATARQGGGGGSTVQDENGQTVYTGWNIDSDEPNSRYTGYAPSETHNQEYALEYGYDNMANWNDYSPYKFDRAGKWGIKGYLIEYSPYTTKSESGTVETIEESEPKTIPDVKKITATETNSSFDVVATNPDNPDDSSEGVTGPTEDTASSAANKYVYDIVLDADVDNVTLTPNIENMTITSIKKGTDDITSDVTDGVVKVTDVKAGEANKVTVEYVVHDDATNTDITYIYNITRKASTETDATVDTADKTPSGKDDKSNVSGADTTETGKKKFTITVPNDQTDVTIITTPKGDATLGSTIQDNLNGTANVDVGSTPGEIKIKDLVVGDNGTVSVEVIAEDGVTKTTYEYTIVREEDTTGKFDVTPSNPDNKTNPSEGITGPTQDTTASKGNDYVYKITLDSDVSKVILKPDMANVTITDITKNGTSIKPIPANGVYTVEDVQPGVDNAVEIKYTVEDKKGVKSTYTYIIDRKNGADAKTEVKDPISPSIPKIEDKGTQEEETNTVEKITITVPAGQDELTIYPNPVNGATIDMNHGTNGVEKVSGPGSVTSDLTNTTKPGLTVGDLTSDENTVIRVKVDSEDGKSSKIYEYTVVRESETTITPVDPAGKDTDKVTEEDDPANANTTSDIYKVITISSTMDELKLIPSLPAGANVTKLVADGSDKTGELAADKSYTVKDIVSGQDRDVVYTVTTSTGTINYHYTIKKEAAPKSTSTDATVDTADKTPSNKDDKSNVSGADTTETGKKKFTITVPNDQTDVTITTTPEGKAKLGSTIQDNLKGKANIDTDSSTPDEIKVKDLEVGNNGTVSVDIIAEDGKTKTTYEYTIVREKNSDTSIDTNVPDKTPNDSSDDATIDDSTPSKTEVIDGKTETVKDIIVKVPYKNTSVTLEPKVKESTSNIDTAYGENGIKKDQLQGTAKVTDDSAINSTDKKSGTITIDDLVCGKENIVSIKVVAEDGSSCIYRYKVTRENGKTNTITPSLPAGSTSTGTITGPTEDTSKTTEDDKYYDIVLPNGTDKVIMTPEINEGDKITSITVDGEPITTIPEKGVYTVTDVTTDKPKDLIYTIETPDGKKTNYHYNISQATKPDEPKKDDPTDKKDPTITDVTVKTDDTVTPADVKIDNKNTNKTIEVTVPANQTDYTFVPKTNDPNSKITEVTKISGPAEVSTSSDGKSFTAKGLDPKTPTIAKVTVVSSTGDTLTYTVTINRAEEGVTPDISVEMDGGSLDLNTLIPDDVRKNAKEILYHCCAHTVLAIDKDGTVRSIGRSNKYKSSLVHVIVKSQDNKWTDYTIYVKVNGATKKEEYGTLVDYKGLNYEITGEDTCRVSSWKTNYNTKKKNIVIPDTIKANGKTYRVTAIAPGAFMRNSKIVTISIGKNVQEIGNTSFVGLRKIKKFTISKKNKYLKVAGKSGNKAKMILSKNGKILYSMTNMQGSVTIPKSVKQITEYAGAGNVKMTKLIIPASVTRIDPCAFAHAKKMTYVQFKGKVPEMANNCVVDQMNYKKGNVYVPKKFYKQYKTTFQTASKKRFGIKQFPAMSRLKKK